MGIHELVDRRERAPPYSYSPNSGPAKHHSLHLIIFNYICHLLCYYLVNWENAPGTGIETSGASLTPSPIAIGHPFVTVNLDFHMLSHVADASLFTTQLFCCLPPVPKLSKSQLPYMLTCLLFCPSTQNKQFSLLFI